jgi:seryl-tRNA synthetase
MAGTLPEGVRWDGAGNVTLHGSALRLADALDAEFVRLATAWDATELRFPTLIPAAELERIDYFRSFPHLATYAACLADGEANLAAFAVEPVTDGAVTLTDVAPVRHVLTPAACYHVYAHHRGERLSGAHYFTTKSACFRRETHYVPLERQWGFTMREIVCIGTAQQTRAFLAAATAAVDTLVDRLGLKLRWDLATDPFFRPSTNPQYLMQRIDPTKHELLYDDRLAVASTNLHHDHFGRAFDITLRDDANDGPAFTACVAFGVERWLAAFVDSFGPDASAWPALTG